MEEKNRTLKEQKKRKMLFILPFLILPFLTMLFWSLGGGKSDLTNNIVEQKRGFNAVLPNPKLKEDSALNKMSYYDQAAEDSIKFNEQIKKDPNYSADFSVKDSLLIGNVLGEHSAPYRKGKNGLNSNSFLDDNEVKMYQKLKALQKAITQPSKSIDNDQDMREFEHGSSDGDLSDEMKNLEQMMSAMNASQEVDPELKQLGGMLENILDIQHPERINEKLRESSRKRKGKVFSMSKKVEDHVITSLHSSNKIQFVDSKSNSFYSLDENYAEDEVQNAVEAVFHETQSIVNGSIVKLRLTSDVYINGILIPKNSFIFGIASLKGERLEVKISNIQFKNSIFPVELTVYDMDGLDGIYIPGAIGRDVAKASADRSLQSIDIAGLDNSWGAQAAGLGVEAAKNLLSKKVKLIKVVVKAGYRILLYDEKEKNEK